MDEAMMTENMMKKPREAPDLAESGIIYRLYAQISHDIISTGRCSE